jgi:hypothetical protein
LIAVIRELFNESESGLLVGDDQILRPRMGQMNPPASENLFAHSPRLKLLDLRSRVSNGAESPFAASRIKLNVVLDLATVRVLENFPGNVLPVRPLFERACINPLEAFVVETLALLAVLPFDIIPIPFVLPLDGLGCRRGRRRGLLNIRRDLRRLRRDSCGFRVLLRGNGKSRGELGGRHPVFRPMLLENLDSPLMPGVCDGGFPFSDLSVPDTACLTMSLGLPPLFIARAAITFLPRTESRLTAHRIDRFALCSDDLGNLLGPLRRNLAVDLLDLLRSNDAKSVG